MLVQVLEWGLQPDFMTGDRGYSSLSNLKTVRHHRMGFLFAVESNRLGSTEQGTWVHVQHLDIAHDGLRVWLRAFGDVKRFRARLKDPLRHDGVFLPDANAYEAFTQTEFQKLHDPHWPIEQYHRLIKPVGHIETFPVRGKVPILNPIFTALCRYVPLQPRHIAEVISNAYGWQRDWYQDGVAALVRTFIVGKEYLNPQFQTAVNA